MVCRFLLFGPGWGGGGYNLCMKQLYAQSDSDCISYFFPISSQKCSIIIILCASPLKYYILLWEGGGLNHHTCICIGFNSQNTKKY